MYNSLLLSIIILLSILNGISARTLSKEFKSNDISIVYLRIFNNSLKIYNDDPVVKIMVQHDHAGNGEWQSDGLEYSELYSDNVQFRPMPPCCLIRYSSTEHYTFKYELNGGGGSGGGGHVNYRFRLKTAAGSVLFGHVFAFDASESSGFRNVSLIDMNMSVRGVLRIDFLVSKPLDLSGIITNVPGYSDTKHLQWTGHRGTGPGLRDDLRPNLFENTIDAFNYVCRRTAQMVELDVHLSRDLVPIIFHDFHRQLAALTNNHSSVIVNADIKDYTVHEHQTMSLPGMENFQLFETFESVLKKMDNDCGIIVEIKYPQAFDNQVMEAELPIDINQYVDRILQVILQYAGRRPIWITSFSADICILFQTKQNLFDVYFLTSGDLQSFPALPWNVYYDPRTVTVRANIAFAMSFNIAGLSLYSDHLYEVRMNDIRLIRQAGLQLAVWGASVDTQQKADRLLELGVNVLILDYVDRFTHNSSSV